MILFSTNVNKYLYQLSENETSSKACYPPRKWNLNSNHSNVRSHITMRERKKGKVRRLSAIYIDNGSKC